MSICCFYMRILLIYACYLEPCLEYRVESTNQIYLQLQGWAAVSLTLLFYLETII